MGSPAAERLELDPRAEADEHAVADWEAAAAGVLRKARRMGEDDPDSGVWERLTRTTLDGIEIGPLGTPALVADLRTGGRPLREGGWDVRVLVEGADPAGIAETALTDLRGGATSLMVQLPDDAAGEELRAALDGVLLDVAPVVLHRPSTVLSDALADLLEACDEAPADGCNLSVDPVTTEMLPHRVPDEGPEDVEESFVRLVGRARDLGVLAAVVDGTAVHERGAGDVQELGWSMAVGVHYLRLLTDAGFSVDEAAALLEFRYAVTDDQLTQIAKLRAARRLWARVLEASGAAGDHEVPQRQHAVTSRAMLTTRDPWVNMLRTTVAAFAAGVGGADAVTVLPFDTALGRPGALGRRVARNTSTLLVEESHVAAVTDPAGGAFAVERLTDDLAVAAWAELGTIEADGGAGADAARRAMVDRVKDLARRRDAEVADRTRPIVGLSEYPNLREKLPTPEPDPETKVPVRRWGWQFEDFRAEPPDRPVFLATMGPLASHTARAGFARNLMAAGGIDLEEAGPTESVDEVVAAYREHDRLPVVMLAGSDSSYAEWGANLVTALREAGATWVVVAGKPEVKGTSLGVDDSAATGVDAVAFLTTTREKLQ